MRLLTGLVLLFSVQAYACPELSGTFTCTYSDGQTEQVVMSQQVRPDGVTVYNYGGTEVVTDNSVNAIPDDETLKEGTFRAWCSDASTLNAQLLGKYFDQGAYYGDLTMNLAFTMVGSDLKQVTTGNLKSATDEYPLDNETTCVRNP